MKNIIKRTLTFLSTCKAGGAYLLLTMLVLATSINAKAGTKTFTVTGEFQINGVKVTDIFESVAGIGRVQTGIEVTVDGIKIQYKGNSSNSPFIDNNARQIESSANSIDIGIYAPEDFYLTQFKSYERVYIAGSGWTMVENANVTLPGNSNKCKVTVNKRSTKTYVTISKIEISYTFKNKGTQNDPYIISTKAAWQEFADKVSGGQTNAYAKLTADINLGEGRYAGMIGTWGNPYGGVFDGQNHKITVNYTTNSEGQQDVGPFRYVSGATIKNLRTSGTFNVGRKFAAGIVARARGNCTLTNCESDVKITTSVSGDATTGGLIADAAGIVNITDCAFYGSITGANATNCGGFIAWPNNTANISNCLQAGTFSLKSTNGSYTFARNPSKVTVTNSYYSNSSKLGNAQGTLAQDKELKNGVITMKLQANRTDACHWEQTLANSAPSIYRGQSSKDNLVYYNTSRGSWYCDNLTITEGTYLPVGLDFTAAKINYARTMKRGENAIYTVCLPYDYTIDQKRFTAYEFGSINGDNTIVTFKETNSKVLKAYRPYVIVPKVDLNGFSVSSATNVKQEIQKTPFAGTINFEQVFSGLSHSEAVGQDYYILQSDGKWHPITSEDATAYIPPYRAALKFSKPSYSAKALAMRFDDNTATGISSIQLEGNDGTVKYYNLRGQYIGTSLDNVPSGIYVGSNGKKFKK